MKYLMIAMLLLLASATTPAQAPALPTDSLYQLQARLVDQDGRALAWRDLRGKPRLVAMFYTSCKYICPLIVDTGKAVEHQLTPSERDRIGIVLVSMDPARDDPQALQAVVDQRKLDTRRWTLASPRAQDVRDIAAVLGIRYRQLADGGFNHGSALVLLDADGRVLARTEKMGTQPEAEFVAIVRKAAGGR